MSTPLKTAPNNLVHKVAWAAIRDRSLLFARSKNQTLFYSLGGKVDQGETSEQALIREAAEEAGAFLIQSTIRHLNTFEGPCHGYVAGTVLKMEYFDAQAKGELYPKSEIEELAWLTSKDKHRTTEMGAIILDWFAANGYID